MAGTDLQTVGATGLTTTKYKTPCSALQSDPQLARKVDDTHPHAQRALTTAERDRLEALLPLYEATLAPVARSEFDRMMGRLVLGYPSAKLSEGEADERLNLYHAGLGDIPGDILGRAFLTTVQAQKYFPSISELRERCSEWVKRQWRAQRIRHMIDRHDAAQTEAEPAKVWTQAEVDDANATFRKLGIATRYRLDSGGAISPVTTAEFPDATQEDTA